MSFPTSVSSYVVALAIDGFLLFFCSIHVSIIISIVITIEHSILVNNIWWADDISQEPYRAVCQPEPPGVARVWPPHGVHPPLPVCGGVVLILHQHPSPGVSWVQVQEQTCDEWARPLWSHHHLTHRQHQEGPGGGLVQGGLLYIVILLLYIWVTVNIFIVTIHNLSFLGWFTL